MIGLAKDVRLEDEIARRGGLGLNRHGKELVGPCPHCGGHDRFAISTTKQVFLCRGCNARGDIIDLVRFLDGVSYCAAVKILGGDDRKPVIGTKIRPTSAPKTDTNHAELALRIWDDASPVVGTLAETYLRGRGLEPPEDDQALRYSSRCPFGDTKYPALIALFRDIHNNEPMAIHRIAIGPDGTLAGKKMLGPVGGCAVKLDADEHVEYGLHIGEGIETGIAGRMLGFRPCWAVGSALAIKTFPVLDGIEALTILVDNDPADRNGRRAGQQAAEECKQRWREAGREVTLVLPKKSGADVADYFGDNNGR